MAREVKKMCLVSPKIMKEKAFTLLEIVVVMAIFLIILLMVFAVADRGTKFYYTASALASLQETGRKALDRMATDLRGTGLSIVTDSQGQPLVQGLSYQEIRFRRNPGYGNDGIPWDEGEAIVYRFDYDTGETDNEVDDDGDGLIDEGVIVRVEDGSPAEIAHNVKEGGLSFILQGSRIVMTVELQDIDENRRSLEASVDTIVYLRNP
ncbi:MAG: hypothetical protein AMS15_04295 [Planctomycetes bacterium DG_23]|nr:MAG: hypothetical protein AMS15_04295 [Planctomycetes bacterium DG_23]